MKQQELFPESKIDISPELHKMAKINPSLCYNELREKGMPIGLSLWFIIDRNMRTNFTPLWNEFERYGKMTYLDLRINGIRFQVVENNSMEIGFFCNEGGNIIFTWDCSMTFDSDTVTKIKAAIKKHVVENQFQFGLK